MMKKSKFEFRNLNYQICQNFQVEIIIFCFRIFLLLKMKEAGELQRVNYSLQKHHRELLHQKIDPKVIQRLQISENPSLNYRKAFESVYHDELQKTIQYQDQKNEQYRRSNSNYRLNLPQINHSSSHQSLHISHQPPGKILNGKYNSYFTDFDEQRKKKFDDLINRGLDGGKSFFKAQQQYQKRKQFQKNMTSNVLKQQLVLNREKKTISKQKENFENQMIKNNGIKQLEKEKMRLNLRKQQQICLGHEIQQQMQIESIKRSRKSYFDMHTIGRHNPITNPIEYHIDNPYILQKYQQKVEINNK